MPETKRTQTALETTRREDGFLPTFGAQMQLQTLEDALHFADMIVKSGMCPKGMTREGAVICMQLGYEVGLSPMQALQNIAPINGRPTVWGDAMLGLVRASGLLESFKEEYIGDPGTDSRGVRCTVKRVGSDDAAEEFTIADAKRAGLWGKPGPWSQYPQRMLKFRARSFVLRDQFADVLKGLQSREEALDYRHEKNVTAEGEDSPAGDAASRLFAGDVATPEKPADTAPTPSPDPLDMGTSIEDLIASVVEAVGVPAELLADWTKALPGRHPWHSGGSLKQIPLDALAEMRDHPDKVRENVNAWVDSQNQ